jgi:4-methyl-5(b-hydroxyethyl)-thiazole monophosphate biosynthesis
MGAVSVLNPAMPAPTVLVLVAEGFEETEAVTPINLLRRAGAEVTLAAVGEGIHVTGRNGMTIHADTTLSAINGANFDCVLVPGGPGVARLREDGRVLALVSEQMHAGRWIAAICAAPVVLNAAGLLKDRRYTAHYSVSSELPALLTEERVVVDGRLITSRGAGTALDFGLRIVENLFTPERASEIAKSICA